LGAGNIGFDSRVSDERRDMDFIYLDEATYDWLINELEKPPQVLPKLKELLEREAEWIS
jgi:uncharacterized protein (DUF1778 family)